MSVIKKDSNMLVRRHDNIIFLHRKDFVRVPRKSEAVESLQDNLKALNTLHQRLKNMLVELEDLVKG